MRREIYSRIILSLLFALGLTTSMIAQSNSLVKEERNAEAFHSLVVGETAIVYFTPATEQKIEVETTKDKIGQIKTEVIDGVLNISNNSLRSPSVLNIYISCNTLKRVDLSGAAEFISQALYETEALNIETGGAAKMELETNANEIIIEMSGGSELILAGSSKYIESHISGSAILDASKLASQNGDIRAYSKSVANVNVKENLKITTHSSSRVDYVGEPTSISRNRINSRRSRDYYADDEYSSYSDHRFGRLNISVGERHDSTIVKLGRHEFIVDEYGNTRYRKLYRKEFNGHWGGVDLGINAYVTPDFSMNYGNRYDFLELNLGASNRLDLNIWEENLPVAKNNKWGFVTGLGLEFRNYRFDNNYTLISDLDEIDGYRNLDVDVKKHKLSASYISVPLLFEFQTNSWGDSRSFHISAGMVFGLKISSKTKMVFKDKDFTYTMEDFEGNLYTQEVGDKRRVKEHNSFHLNPIKADAMIRFGWGWFNFYATYAITEMFKKNEGPELYPISFGITLVKW